MKRKAIYFLMGFTIILFYAGDYIMNTNNVEGKQKQIKVYNVEKGKYIQVETVIRTDKEWKELLTPFDYHVLREKGTERAFTGEHNKNNEKGIYRCKGCGDDLFHSDDKFDSGTGWPSYTRPVAMENIKLKEDKSLFMVRTEVLCARCGSHLGHVFDDGPAPEGKRYCINSVSLTFAKK